ncbi:glycosyltransferase [Candidatus Peregrinibacteria bacterium CG10_big_fil_rev_8_21_14_0_10_49_16]|nr:MAG: glycosyltransferase [Candidatus Peregrinibacteria bacterium CG22_combo_CG10-13_8_21_14_all_49_11]PIR52157.1 MAG: glycosyltransferase [Candidatus Peregrinibacteria bacterium CG10_big_fil_rev_8_21_14_0_10_49_16]
MTHSPLISVVLPLFNEEESVDELIERTVRSCITLDMSFEIIAVNDGSTDATFQKLTALSAEYPEVRILDLFRNVGHMAALSAGLHHVHGKAVIIMDGDLQDPPELIPSFVEHWRNGEADIVCGKRAQRGEGRWYRLCSHVFYRLLSRASGAIIPEQVGTCCLLDRRVVDALDTFPEKQRFFAGLRAWVGGRQVFITYERLRRKYGYSRVGGRGLIRLARTAFISFSKVPLRYVSLFSLCAALLLFFVGVTAMGIRLFTDLAIPGWATFTMLIGFVGFVQSLVLAVMAEYIAVIFDETKARPLYLIRQEIRNGYPISETLPSSGSLETTACAESQRMQIRQEEVCTADVGT